MVLTCLLKFINIFISFVTHYLQSIKYLNKHLIGICQLQNYLSMLGDRGWFHCWMEHFVHYVKAYTVTFKILLLLKNYFPKFKTLFFFLNKYTSFIFICSLSAFFFIHTGQNTGFSTYFCKKHHGVTALLGAASLHNVQSIPTLL